MMFASNLPIVTEYFYVHSRIYVAPGTVKRYMYVVVRSVSVVFWVMPHNLTFLFGCC